MDKIEWMDRLLDLGARSIRCSSRLPKTDIGKHIGMQLMRAATSAGANYCEACGAESRKDFIHKLQIAIKELREADYWLRLIVRSKILDPNRFSKLIDDTNQLLSILIASVNTARRRSTKQ